MKNLVLVSLVLFTLTLSAQEKQNDATWEETIEFLKKNIHYLNKTSGSRKHAYEIDDEQIVKNRYLGKNESKYILRLNDLDKIVYENNRYFIYSYGKYVKNEVNGILRNHSDFFPVGGEIGKNYLRVIKALEHLAYLANNKRPESKF